MLKIQVMGKGMIPRDYGLAPRIEPFFADRTLIATILSTPGLKVNMIHPDDNHPIQLTNQNLKRMWDTFSDYTPEKKSTVPMTAPVTPGPKNNYAPAPTVKQNEVNVSQNKTEQPAVVEPVKDKKEEGSDKVDQNQKPVDNKPTTFKPVNADDKKGK